LERILTQTTKRRKITIFIKGYSPELGIWNPTLRIIACFKNAIVEIIDFQKILRDVGYLVLLFFFCQYFHSFAEKAVCFAKVTKRNKRGELRKKSALI
jgi:hypothetical protein